MAQGKNNVLSRGYLATALSPEVIPYNICVIKLDISKS